MNVQCDMCGSYLNYVYSMLTSPINLNILIISLVLSLTFFVLFKKLENIRNKILFLYAHIAFLFLPFITSVFLLNCTMPVLRCSTKIVILGTSGGLLTAMVLGFLILPYIYGWANKSTAFKSPHIRNFLKEYCKKLSIKEPRVYTIDDAKPMAYSISNIKPAIFLSVGLCELLTKKELESVILHELYHIKNNASLFKFSMNLLGVLSPLSTFITSNKSLAKEEAKADTFAIKLQRTTKYLSSAKTKVNRINQEFID